ncbi:TPA: 50S ribosomal protein L22 [Candidatus Ventrenecus stercoripullorum]|nr:50S ribosomal protein L22 [Candidatus Ventrenecus stercoripullorum]
METYAIHKSAMVAPRKARMTMDLIRGKDIQAARAILDTTNTKSSRLIKKVLESAISNAVNNFDAKESDLFISECMVNPGPVYKRVKFASRGNVDRRDKRTSHIIVRVSDGKGGNN